MKRKLARSGLVGLIGVLIMTAFLTMSPPIPAHASFTGLDGFNFSSTFSASATTTFAPSGTVTVVKDLVTIVSYCNPGTISIKSITDSAGNTYGWAGRMVGSLKQLTTEVWWTKASTTAITSITILYNQTATACIIDGQGYTTTANSFFTATAHPHFTHFTFAAELDPSPIQNIAIWVDDSIIITTGILNITSVGGGANQKVTPISPSIAPQAANGHVFNVNGIAGVANEGYSYQPVLGVSFGFGFTFADCGISCAAVGGDSARNYVNDQFFIVFSSNGSSVATACSQGIGSNVGDESASTKALTSNITYFYVGTSPAQGLAVTNESLVIHDTTLTNGQTKVSVTFGVYYIAGTSGNPLVGNTNAIGAGNPLTLKLISKTTVSLNNGLGVTYVTLPINTAVIATTTWAVALSVSHAGVTVLQSKTAVTLYSDTPDGLMPTTMTHQSAEGTNAYLYGLANCPSAITSTTVTTQCSATGTACVLTNTQTSFTTTDFSGYLYGNMPNWFIIMVCIMFPPGIFLPFKRAFHMGSEGIIIGMGLGIALALLYTSFPFYAAIILVLAMGAVFSRR